MTILTIDFDVIMSPIINFYNDMIDSLTPIGVILKDYPFLEKNLPANFYQYQYLTRIIVEFAKSKIPIDFISNHQDVIGILKKEKLDNIDVINIDHHHDIGYDSVEDWNKPVKKLECGNWVKYGIDNKIINKYTWVYNENSSHPDTTASKKYLFKGISFRNFSDRKIENIDRVIVCASWGWIPDDYIPLFNTWISLVDIISDSSH